MERNKAISIIARYELENLSKKEREEELLSWWGIDHENPEFHVLPSELQQEILQSDEPVTDVRDRGYDPLLTISLKSEFVGVKNEYLSERISKILGKKILVEGKEETLLTCPCCNGTWTV